MIYIEEKQSTKLPTETSLYVSFNYNPDIVNIIKSCYTCVYDKDTKIWEVPIPCLSFLLDKFSNIDDIKLITLADKSKKEDRDFELLKYKTNPFNYQIEGIKYGLNHDKWLLLDAPGLGKTLQLIYLAEELKEREGIEHCLIICGLNTLKMNWKKEIEKHSNLSCMILGERVSKKGKYSIGSVQDRIEDLKKPIEQFFIITNIESLRSEDLAKQLSKNKYNKIGMIALDEAHVCKSPTSEQTKGLMKLTAKHQVAATGTLLLNNPLDCYVALKWIGKERSTLTNFKYFFCNYGGTFNNELLGFKNMDMLQAEIDSCSLRRTKDLLDLPSKTIIEEYVEMNPDQEKFYNNIKSGIVDQVDKVEMTTSSLLAMIARLRQATACPSILTTENVSSAKIDRACDLIDQLVTNGEKVVVFSTFKETLKTLEDRLKHYNYVLGHGDLKDEQVSANVDKFQNDPSCQIFLGTWQKAGTGITLNAASYMVFIDCPWTQGVFEQAQDRIHRIGSKHPVFIYHLITKNTIDERVKEILDDKGAMADYVIDDKITEKSLMSLKKYIMELQ